MTALAAVEQLAPVSLDELNDRAELTTRRDRKYLVPLEVLPSVLEAVGPLCRALEIDGRREFAYDTMYYDSPERRSFLDTARRRPFRHKIRTRRYVDSRRNWLEVKQRSRRGITVKHRFEYEGDDHRFGDDEREIVAGILGEEVASSDLGEKLTTRFGPSTLLVGDVA